MKRETTSSLCVLSLALILIGYLLSTTATVSKLFPENVPFANAISGLLSALYVLCLLAGFVLAIIGLTTYSSKTPPYIQGKTQAIWTLVLSGSVVSLGVVSIFSKPLSSNRQTTNFSTEEIVNESLNFRFKPPGRPWTALNAKSYNPDASIMYRRARPAAIYINVSERVGLDRGFTNEMLVELSQSNVLSNEGEFDFEDMAPQEVNGIQYSVFRTTAKNYNNQPGTTHFVHWVAARNGFCTQHIFYLAKDDAEGLAKTAAEFVSRFRPYDPKFALQSLRPPIEPTVQKSNGFSIDLSGSEWGEYEGKADDYPDANFAAMRGNYMSTGITSFDLGDLNPDIDVLASGCANASFGLKHPSKTKRRKEIEQGPAKGIELEFSGEGDAASNTYLFRVLRSGSRAWFLTAWGDRSYENLRDDLESTLDAYEIFDPVNESGDMSSLVVSDEATKALAKIFNQVGLSYYNRDAYRSARPYFETAFELAPTNGQYFENIIDSMKQRREEKEALSLLEKYLPKFPSNPNLLIYKAYFLVELERPEEAAEAYQAAFENGEDGIDQLLDYVNVLVDLEKQEFGIEELKKFRENHPGAGNEVERWEAELLTQLDRYDEAIELLGNIHDKFPSDVWVIRDLTRAQVDAENYSDALAVLEEAEAEGFENSQLLLQKGRAKLNLDSYREAKEIFEEALDLDPDNDVLLDYLDHASAMLGKGNISLIKTPIEPVPLPSEVAQKVAELDGAHFEELDEKFGAVQKTRSYGIYFKVGEPEKRTLRASVKICDSNGLDDYSTLRFYFDPLTESIYINDVWVEDEDGKEVARGSVDDYFIVDENDDDLATTDKIVHVPVPGLEVGRTLHYSYTRKDFAPAEEFDFLSYAMSSEYPNTGRILYVTGDARKIETDRTSDISLLPLERGIGFYSEKPPVQRYESYQPWTETFIPWVWMNQKGTDWKKLGAEYLDKLTDVLETNDKVAAKQAKAAIGEAKTDAEKAFTAADYVSTLLTYQGIEFGERGLIPNTIGNIVGNRYGDCKDHSLLIKRILDSAGVEAHLALVSTGAPVKEGFPSLDQFNHMIVYVPGLPGSPFVDGTADHFPAGYLPPEQMVGEKALVLDPSDIRLETIHPAKTPNRIVSRRTVTVGKADFHRADVEETLILTGFPAVWMRNFFFFNQAPDYKSKLASMLRHFGSPRIESISLENLKDLRKPFSMTVRYSVPRINSKQANRLRFEPPAVWEHYFLELHNNGDRHNPFETLKKMDFESECAIHYPNDWESETDINEIYSFKSDDEFTEWTMNSESPNAGTAVLKSRCQQKTGKFDAARFDDFTDSRNLGLNSWDKALVFLLSGETTDTETGDR